MRLDDVIPDTTTDLILNAQMAEWDVNGLTCDSRQVEPGFLFAALPGTRADGRTFIAQAVERGARFVLAPTGTELPRPANDVALLTHPNPRRLFALMAARFFGAQPATVAAVTGTNGKTSVAWFLRQMWAGAGHPAAALGTLGLTTADGITRPGLTTPDPVALHATLAELARDGIDHVAMEASSHGLDQYRLDGVALSAAAFTNLSRDHLDYHGTMDAYLDAKARLFTDILPAGGWAVLNADDDAFAALAARCRDAGHRVVTFGQAADADLRLIARRPTVAGQDLELDVLGLEVALRLPLVGDFQAANALCALGLALGTGLDRDTALAALSGLAGAPGRMELAGHSAGGAAAFVDFAHTPDALALALAAIRPHVRGRLVVVFGAGGDRDPGKRPLMGQAAARGADAVIVTDDNPRTEDPAAIRAAVLAGCPEATEVADRAEAIRAGVALLGDGDLLLVAGKGHEQGQIIGDTVRPFDDLAETRAALAEAGR